MRYLVLGGILAAVFAARAEAQQPYPIEEMNFDMWCQEDEHLSPDRCDKRLPQDDAKFNAYRATIEKYEIPHLQEKQSDANLNRDIIHNEPVDNPAQSPSVPQNSAGTLPCSGVITCTLMPPTSQNSVAPPPAGNPSTPQN